MWGHCDLDPERGLGDLRDQVVFPEFFPPVAGILSGPDGQVWVHEGDTDETENRQVEFRMSTCLEQAHFVRGPRIKSRLQALRRRPVGGPGLW